MSGEIFFIPTEASRPVTLEELRARIASAGVPCTIEDEMGAPCFVLQGSESVIHLTVEGDMVTSAMVDWSLNDSPERLDKIGSALEETGFDAGPDEV